LNLLFEFRAKTPKRSKDKEHAADYDHEEKQDDNQVQRLK